MNHEEHSKFVTLLVELTRKDMIVWGQNDSCLRADVDGLVLKITGSTIGTDDVTLTIYNGDIIVYRVKSNLQSGMFSLCNEAEKHAEVRANKIIRVLESKLRMEAPSDITPLEINREA